MITGTFHPGRLSVGDGELRYPSSLRAACRVEQDHVRPGFAEQRDPLFGERRARTSYARSPACRRWSSAAIHRPRQETRGTRRFTCLGARSITASLLRSAAACRVLDDVTKNASRRACPAAVPRPGGSNRDRFEHLMTATTITPADRQCSQAGGRGGCSSSTEDLVRHVDGDRAVVPSWWRVVDTTAGVPACETPT